MCQYGSQQWLINPYRSISRHNHWYAFLDFSDKVFVNDIWTEALTGYGSKCFALKFAVYQWPHISLGMSKCRYEPGWLWIFTWACHGGIQSQSALLPGALQLWACHQRVSLWEDCTAAARATVDIWIEQYGHNFWSHLIAPRDLVMLPSPHTTIHGVVVDH